LRNGEQPLRKKGRGRLIHVSDFINSASGRLVIQESDGTISQDARVVIYPGSNGDAWWDTEQLLRQVKDAIQISKSPMWERKLSLSLDSLQLMHLCLLDALKAF